MVYRNTTIRGIPTPSTKQGGGGAPSQEGWAPATQGPMGQLLITLIALLTRPRSLIVEALNVQTRPEFLKERSR